jgi:amino acid adenylation domain-containing protein
MAPIEDALAALTPEQRAAFELLLRRQRAAAPAPAAIPRRADPSTHPLSFAQRRLWFLDQLAPGDPAYNIHGAVRLRGRLDAGALARALSTIAARHEPLRARFGISEGEPVQRVDLPAPVPLPVVDLAALPSPLREPEVLCCAAEEARRPFDLTRGPLLRTLLLRTDPEGQVLLLTIHHIAADGWSIGVLLRELTELYIAFKAGRSATLPPLPIDYADFAAWQRERLQGERLAAEVEHWRTRLAGLPPLRLTSDLEPAEGSRGALVPVTVPAALTQRLHEIARQGGASLFMALFAVFEILLARWSGQRDFGVGAPVANRTRPELEGLIGFFVNTLVLRADLEGDPTFAGVLRRAERTLVDALAHQELPFERLVEELQPERRLGHTPFFTAVLALQNLPAGAARLRGLEVTLLPVRNGTARFDLTLSLAEEGGELVGDLEYRRGVLSDPAARRMAGHLGVLLAAVTEDPGRPLSSIALLTAAERHQILIEWAGPEHEWPEDSLMGMFEQQAARSPETIAVVCGAASMTYRELDHRSAELALRLRHLGAGPETVVAICVERSLEMAVGLLGILRSGAAYLPIDPLNPRERQAFLLEDGGASILLTQERWAGDFQGRPVILLDTPTPGPFPAERERGSFGHLQAVLYTSGSTGRPKATLLDARGLLNLCLWFRDVCPIRPHTRSLLGFSFSFDAAFKNIFVPLLVGGRTVLAPPGPFDAGEMLEAIRRERVTFLNTTPGQMIPILQRAAGEGWAGLESLETLILGGEAAPWAELRPWLDSGRCRAEILHMYGPSEASDTVSCHRATSEEIATAGRLPVGRATDNMLLLVVDADLQPLPVGVSGELCLAGIGLARGYLARPELTAEKFIPSPWGIGERMYRTGDVARWRSDGSVEVLGRIDHQIKIRGIRVEPSEVEAVLLSHPAVGGAVVGARESATAGKRLIAWIVPAEGGAPPVGALRELLRERLPDVMIPAAFVVLDAFPLTPRGKVDRSALPEPETALEPEGDEGRPESLTPAEELMAGIWADVLGREDIRRDDDFFQLGGHSLLATRVVARVRAAFGIDLPVRRLFEHPTVAGLAAEIGRLVQEDAMPVPPPRRRPHGARVPLSFAQHRLWLLHQLDPGLLAYHIPAGLRLRGRLDRSALEQALSTIVRRHEVLRTSFPLVGGEPAQVVHRATPLQLPTVNLTALPPDLREGEARRIGTAAARRPLDLERGPLLRLHLLRLKAEEHVLLLVVHHLVSDGWSTGVFLRELTALAAGVPLPEPTLQYADWALWQREWLRGAALEEQLRWWRTRLDAAPRVLDLPTDFPRPPVESQAGAALPVRLPQSLVAALRRLARAEGATLYMVLLAAFQTLLARRAGEETVSVGTHVAGRERLESEELIGFFVNTLVIRADLDGNPSGHALLGRVRESVLGAFAHQDLPFERLVEALNPVRDPRWSPLIQCAFTLQNAPREDLRLPGLEVEVLDVEPGTVQLDLALTLAEDGDGAVGGLRYRTALWSAPTLQRLVTHYTALLEGLADDPGRPVLELPLLTAAESSEMMSAWSGLAVPGFGEDETFPALFEAQVDRTPEAPAVVAAGRRLTYRELDRRANRLARSLLRHGIGPETRVAVRLERSPEMLVALLGIWKAGGTFVPIDGATPPERQTFLRHDAAVALELISDDLEGLDVSGESDERPGIPVVPEQMAYVIYTSGSTGRPKGVMISHRSLAAFARGLDEVFVPQWRRARFGLNASLVFDASLQAVVRLLAGDCVWIVPEEARHDADRLAAFFRAADLDGFDCTPSQLDLVLAAMEASGRPPRCVLVGGEPVSPALWRRMALSTRTVFWNVYGPTECTVNSSMRRIGADAADRRPGAVTDIGGPWPGLRLWLLEASGLPAPEGARAEIWAGGAQVGRGYLGRPELTADRFRPDPFSGEPGARIYRTGDLGRWRPGGRIELLGRADQQVKLRGHRIELGEIEAQLLTHPLVREAAAGVRGERLLAWIVSDDSEADLRALRLWLGERLPGPMVPAVLVRVEALPRTLSGKLDRRALPDPEEAEGVTDEHAAGSPSDPIEARLLDLFREVLGVRRVLPSDSLFELGGHSLTAFRLATRIRESFGLRIAVPRLFATPTPAGLAEVLRGMEKEDGGLPPVRRVPRDRPLPLSLAQQRLWVLHRLAPELTAYHIPAALRLRGPLEITILRGALTEILRRHETLRTAFPLRANEPVQEIAPAAPADLPLLDLSALATRDCEPEARRIVAAEAARRFDLDHGPLLRCALLRLKAEEHVLLLVVHHLVSDGWSAALFLRELSALYAAFLRGEPSPLPEPRVQYADWAVWQREQLHGELLDSYLRWWTGQLADAPRVLDLPTDRPRPPIEIPAGASVPLRLPEPLVEALRRLAVAEGATLYMTLLAGFQALLARMSGQETVCVGSPVARRHRLEVEGLIGFFVNTVVIRTDMTEEPTSRALVGRVREAVFGAFAHQDLPFERLVEALDPERDPRWSPLFQVSFALQSAPREHPHLPGLDVELLDTDTGTTQFDLVVALSELAETGDAAGAIRYRTALFFETTIRRLARHWEALLQEMAEEPDRLVLELPLLSEEERFQVLEEWGGRSALPPKELFLSAFEAQADRTPGAPAVVFAGTMLTYRELDRRANHLAHHLRLRGVGPETRVMLRLERSTDLLAAVLAVWKAGGAYVPVDPATPYERLETLRKDAGILLELTGEDLARLPGESTERLGLETAPEQLAYVIYTSGSTGRPKGVMISHGSLIAFLRALESVLDFSCPRFALNASLAFDASLQALVAFLTGGCIHLLPEDARRDADRLATVFRETDLDGLDCTPSQVDLILDTLDASGRSPRFILVGGEPIPPPLWRRLAARSGTRFWNVYGPTECTIDVTARPIDEEGPDLGRPLPGTSLHLLEATGLPAPAGARAEVWAGGSQVARGYLERPDLTADRFRPDPFSGEAGARLYRTGDLGRWLPDGRIDLLGRADRQIKLRGIRIEIGEIEASLAAHPQVREAAVDLRETSGGPLLAAWVVSAGSALDISELRHWLRERLPEAMIPASFAMLDALPRTVSGKLDRRALPAPTRIGAERPQPPRDRVELRLAGLFAEVLGIAEVGVRDSFFDLGGHSLAAVRLASRVREVFGLAVPVAALFEMPTVEVLARRLREGGRTATGQLVPLRPCGDREPLFLLPPGGGSVFAYLDLVRRLRPGRPVFGLQAPGLEAGEEPLRTVDALADLFLTEIRRVQPRGSRRLAGWSFGGLLAFEIARRLRAVGEEIAGLALIDPTDPVDLADSTDLVTFDEATLRTELARELGLLYGPDEIAPAELRRRFELFRTSAGAARAFRPGFYDGPLDLFEAAERPRPAAAWRPFARRIAILPGDHYSLLAPPAVDALAEALSGW